MTAIYIIRHAEAEGNLYRIAQGQYDSILTDRGWRQVQALERRFADIPIDAVYTSDLYRACATASAIYKPKRLPVHRLRELREICVGRWEQLTWGEIALQDPVQMENFRHEMHLWHVDGAETPLEVQRRILAAVRKIAKENDEKRVAVISHGAAIRLLLAALQGYSLEELGKTSHGDNTAVSLLEAEGETIRVVFRDDNSHLARYAAEEKVFKRSTALEPGLCFKPLESPELPEVLAECVAEAFTGRGNVVGMLSEDACNLTWLALLPSGQTVGLIRLGEKELDRGPILLLCIRREYRKQGFGAQLIGQAVRHFRPLGVQRLTAVLPKRSAAEAFFRDYGFVPVGKACLEKDISFKKEFLAI